MNRTRVLVLTALALHVIAWPAIARADEASCIEANETSINLRRDGKLRDALKVLAECTDPACPSDVKDACAKRIAKVNEAMPTIVFGAKNGAGEDVTNVSVTMDGAPLLTTLDGRPLALDPGSHTFVFTAKGQPPVERTLVIREGEKTRQESVRVGPAAPAPPPDKPVQPAPPPSGAWGTQKKAGVVVAAVGVVGVGLGATFGLLARGEQSKEKEDCNTTSCPNRGRAGTEYDGATRDATISTIGFISGGALLAGGAALFFLVRTSDKTDPKSGSIRLSPSVDAQNRGFVLRGEF